MSDFDSSDDEGLYNRRHSPSKTVEKCCDLCSDDAKTLLYQKCTIFRDFAKICIITYNFFIYQGVAGMFSKTTVAPLDRIKILLQAHNVHYKHLGVLSGLKEIIRRERFFALYKGNGAQMVRIFPYAATQFTVFEIYKKIGIIGGSGLNNPDILDGAKEVFVDTPFGAPSDCLIIGKIKGVDCVILARHGRKHTINPSNVNYRANIWALKQQGCTHVITSTACGSLQEDISPGDLVLLDSFIDRTKNRIQTFFDGSKEGLPGVCHIPMEPAFCNDTRKIILEAAAELGITMHPSGVAVTIEGPRFSSKAESHLFRSWGAQLVNMTLVPEVVLAKEAGLCYAAVAMATDYDCWRDHGDGVCVADVMTTFKKNVEKITKLFLVVVPKIADRKWDDVIKKNRNTVETSNMLPQEPAPKS